MKLHNFRQTRGPPNSLLLLEIRRGLKMQSPNSSLLKRRKKYGYLLGSFKTCEKNLFPKNLHKKLVALHLVLLS